MINESVENAHKTFLSLSLEKQRKHRPNRSTLPSYSTPAATSTNPAPNSRAQSNTFPKTFRSGFISGFAIHYTMNLQPHGSFAGAINTFRESCISSLDLVNRETILLSPVLVFCVWVLLVGWLVVINGFFSSLSLFSL